MVSENSENVAREAKRIYKERLRASLEESHMDEYVAIEPDSGEHFLAKSYSEAVAASRAAHPERIAFVIRVGHKAASHIGVMTP